MMTHQQLHHHIESSYPIGGGDVRCCKKIADAILRDTRPLYTYGNLLDEANSGSDVGFSIGEVQFAINVLKGSRVRLLCEVYRYIDDDVIYDVSLEDLQAARQDGFLHVELRGYPDRNYKSKVYVMFAPDRAVISDEL